MRHAIRQGRGMEHREGGRVFYLQTFLNPFNRFSQWRATKGLVGDRTGAY